MSKRMPGFSRGMTLIELMIAMVIVVVLVAMAVQGFQGWTRDMVVRSSAESILSGLQIARAEALKRNSIVHFQLVDTLGSDCALSNSGPHWVVSRDSAVSQCDVEPMNSSVPSDPPDPPASPSDEYEWSKPASTSTDSGGPYTVQKYDGTNALKGKVEIGAEHNDFSFDGMGRLDITAKKDIVIGIKNDDGEWKQSLRIQLMPGGGVRMCNPGSNIDTQKC
jgi:type IV fimbrial biogenesis protein FimT